MRRIGSRASVRGSSASTRHDATGGCNRAPHQRVDRELVDILAPIRGHRKRQRDPAVAREVVIRERGTAVVGGVADHEAVVVGDREIDGGGRSRRGRG
jgi:hypothetical protein